MTTIAWDGVSLAADKMSNSQGTISTVTKIWRISNHLIGGSGNFSSIMSLRNWFSNGCIKDEWPECQKDKDRCSTLLVITPDGKIQLYDHDPYPCEIEDVFHAIGGGRDFAMGAMEMGASAHQAVMAASRWDTGTGNGVDVLSLRNA